MGITITLNDQPYAGHGYPMAWIAIYGLTILILIIIVITIVNHSELSLTIVMRIIHD